MTDPQNEMLRLFQEEYWAKVYGFARVKCNQIQEAEELAGDIVLQVVRHIRRGGSIEHMNAFVWKVSNNLFLKMLRQKKTGNTLYLTELIPAEHNIEEEFFKVEAKSTLRREMALLSQKYRQTLILHYFEGKTCEEIAKIIEKPSGTVKWWLHEAKKRLKGGMNTMREYGEKSFNPSTLSMSCQGNPGANWEPMSCARRKSAQNILLAAYKEPLSVTELSLELGIAVPYIEDEAEYLCEQQLMKKTGDQYQTDFVILSGQSSGLSDKIYALCIPDYFERLLNLLENNKETLSSPPFNPSGFTWERLLWMYLHLCTDLNLYEFKRQVCKIVTYADTPDRPNGGKWIALGWENDFPSFSQEPFKAYQPWDGPVHKSDNEMAQGFFHFWSGLDSSIFFDIPNGVFALCRDIIKDIKKTDALNEEERLLFSYALEKKLFIKVENGFKLNYCFIGAAQMRFIHSLCKDFCAEACAYFEKAYRIVTDEYEKNIPKHLHWQMGNLLSNHLNVFVTASLYEAFNKGLLSMPDEENKAWLSLFATE